MKKSFKSCLVLAMVLAFGITSAQAADNLRKRSTNKDRTCQSYTKESNDMTLAADRKRLRDGSGTGTPSRKRDRSCQSYVAPTDDETFSLAANKRSRNGNGSGNRSGQGTGKGLQKRDGSCQTYVAPMDDETFSLAANKRTRSGSGSGNGIRSRDRSCLI